MALIKLKGHQEKDELWMSIVKFSFSTIEKICDAGSSHQIYRVGNDSFAFESNDIIKVMAATDKSVFRKKRYAGFNIMVWFKKKIYISIQSYNDSHCDYATRIRAALGLDIPATLDNTEDFFI